MARCFCELHIHVEYTASEATWDMNVQGFVFPPRAHTYKLHNGYQGNMVESTKENSSVMKELSLLCPWDPSIACQFKSIPAECPTWLTHSHQLRLFVVKRRTLSKCQT
ncbi:hypothetical protein LIER_37398 [Lithospermum erythrorhizon]|uniref:Uncharacterized protein n=1 Tax=Lithospermum erythrorhizon TaxID=34254 RepID=A0AAV3PJZ6_LITER